MQNSTETTQQREQGYYRQQYKKAYKCARDYGKFDKEMGSRLDCYVLAGLSGVEENICKAALKSYYSRKHVVPFGRVYWYTHKI